MSPRSVAFVLVFVLVVVVGVSASSRTSASAAPGVRVTSNCPEARLEQRQTDGAVQVSWHFEARPTEQHCAFDVQASGERLEGGPAQWVDATGLTKTLQAQRTPEGLRYTVSAEWLDEARYPAVLDPRVSASVQAAPRVMASVGSGPIIASDGTTWVVLGRLFSNARVLSSIDGSGVVTQGGQVRGETVLFTNRYHLVGADGDQAGVSMAALLDAGPPSPLPWFTPGTQLFPARGGALFGRPLPNDAGGTDFQFGVLGADLNWDGGGLRAEGATAMRAAVAFGATDFLVQFTDGTGDHLVQANPQAPVAEIFSADGGRFPQPLLAGGGGEALVLWADSATSAVPTRFRLVNARIEDQLPGGPQRASAVTWDGLVFRVATHLADGGVGEYFIDTAGAVSPFHALVAPRLNNLFGIASEAYGEANARTLFTWGTFGTQFALFAPGAAGALDGGAVFTATNGLFSTSLARRGNEVLASWNDDRIGGEIIELWTRRFSTDLVPLDTDAIPTNPRLEHLANTRWVTFGPRNVAATDAGFLVVSTNGFNICLQALDSSAQATGAVVPLTTNFGLNGIPHLVSNEGVTLAGWRWVVGDQAQYAIVDAAGAIIAGPTDVGLPNEFFFQSMPVPGGFVVYGRHEVARLSTAGVSSPLPFGPLGEFILTAATDGERMLFVTTEADAGTFARTWNLSDGGAGRHLMLRREVAPWAGAVWDGTHFSVVVSHELSDAGHRLSALRLEDDGGWSAPLELQTVPNSTECAVVEVPDAGLVLAFHDDEIRLQRVQWLDLGGGCGSAAECTSGFCVDGVCCAEACNGGTGDCRACSVAAGGALDGRCGPVSQGVLCRSSSSVCDVAEVCDGVSAACPADGFADAGVVCRASVASCDAPETCTGTDVTCPADAFADAGVLCRSASDVCDATEQCTGAAPTCPPDTFADAGLPCRAASDVCDAPAQCTGDAATCPPNPFADSSVVCRAASSSCDVEERCAGQASCPGDLRSDAGVCVPSFSVGDPALAACRVTAELPFTLTGDEARVSFTSSDDSVTVDLPARVLRWTPQPRTPATVVTVVVDGVTARQLEWTSDCETPRYAVGCGCDASAWGVMAVPLAMLLRRRRHGVRVD